MGDRLRRAQSIGPEAPLGRLSDSEIQHVRVWVHRMLG